MLIYFETEDLDLVKHETTIFKNRELSHNTPIREWIGTADPQATSVLYGTEVFNPDEPINFAIDHLVLAHNKGMMFSDGVKSTFKERNQTLNLASDHVFPAFVAEIDGSMSKIPIAYDNIVDRSRQIEEQGIEYLGPLLVSPRFIFDFDGDPLDLFIDVINYGPSKLSWCDIGVTNIASSGNLADIFTSFTYPVHDGSVIDYSSYPHYDEEKKTIDGIPAPLFPEGSTMYEGKYIQHLFNALVKE